MAQRLHSRTLLESAVTQAQEAFRANRCYYEIYILGGCIEVDVRWGDWKHDHGYVDHIMHSLGLSKLDERITEEDQSDCYSSVHIFRQTNQHHIMAQINTATIRGIVGSVRIYSIGDTEVARFSVATDYWYRDAKGNSVIETTWHQVSAFKGVTIPDLSFLKKGAGVEVTGRLRNTRYAAADGSERSMTEILASSVKPVEG